MLWGNAGKGLRWQKCFSSTGSTHTFSNANWHRAVPAINVAKPTNLEITWCIFVISKVSVNKNWVECWDLYMLPRAGVIHCNPIYKLAPSHQNIAQQVRGIFLQAHLLRLAWSMWICCLYWNINAWPACTGEAPCVSWNNRAGCASDKWTVIHLACLDTCQRGHGDV